MKVSIALFTLLSASLAMSASMPARMEHRSVKARSLEWDQPLVQSYVARDIAVYTLGEYLGNPPTEADINARAQYIAGDPWFQAIPSRISDYIWNICKSSDLSRAEQFNQFQTLVFYAAANFSEPKERLQMIYKAWETVKASTSSFPAGGNAAFFFGAVIGDKEYQQAAVDDAEAAKKALTRAMSNF